MLIITFTFKPSIGLCVLVATALGIPSGSGSSFGLTPESATTRAESLRGFTVSDSITMTHLVTPSDHEKNSHPDVSPNGKKFLLVTERGNINTNRREYSLYVYDAQAPTATPIHVVKFESSSNRDGIYEARWLDDNNISFIGETPGATPQVFVVDWRVKKPQKTTSDPTGVIAYGVSHDLRKTIYYSTWQKEWTENKFKEDHGFVVSGESLTDLLTNGQDAPRGVYQIHIIDRGKSTFPTVKASPIQAAAARLRFWLSPNGRYAITEQPPFSVDSRWREYEQPYLRRLSTDYQGPQGEIRPYGLMQAMLVDLETGDIKPIVNAPTGIGGLQAAWSPNGKSVFIGGIYLPLGGTDADEETRRKSRTVLAEIEIPSLTVGKIAEIPKDETWRILEAKAPERFKAERWRLEEGDIFKRLPNWSFTKQGSSWGHGEEVTGAGPDRSSEITVSQDIDQRPKLIVVEKTTQRKTVVFDPNPQFDALTFGRPEVIRWTGKRSEPLTGELIYPVGYSPGTRYPLVIQTHGIQPGMFIVDGPFTTAMAAQALANKGIAVLQLGESPLYDQTQGTLDFGPANLSQLESAVDYLDHLGVIDPRHVGLVGFSATCFTVEYALLHSQYGFAAATSADGNDYGYWSYVAYANTPAAVSQVEMLYGGAPWGGKWKVWLEQSVSFVNYDAFHTPVRLESESNPGDIFNEWEMFIALRRLHKPVELVYEAHGSHPLVKPWDRLTSQQGNVDWMVFWLKGEEDPDPQKRDQYARWHKLRDEQKADVQVRSSESQLEK